MAFPFGKSGMANPLDILVLRKERQNKLFERKIKTCPSDFVAVVKQAALKEKAICYHFVAILQPQPASLLRHSVCYQRFTRITALQHNSE